MNPELMAALGSSQLQSRNAAGLDLENKLATTEAGGPLGKK